MMRESSSCELKNEGCHICLEDEAKDPMYCLQCLKIIACKVCFRDYLRECKETLLKCLNCQRPSIVMYSLFNKVAKQKNDKFYAQIPEQYFDIVEDEEEVEEGS
ncbi:unnamed protein product [Bursaphelenchus okinawaensis]|uniref:Uncharacterized protein n=1 Tax=Bursaphelenchus okinawaensis TaxID=465554 RepID=A0A811JS10_9BILA|nr:unnamed protein product [Bursaphelenchus okinawaensis]CAG9080564.1 unnamed protein product [Bursaphelenchus okinawaensis]